ncbi:MAG: glycosyltransferase [Deltaproteobacteria bacterium]|nr:MAG: glycosyltransferase [Deltaproteobacteria bacterium]
MNANDWFILAGLSVYCWCASALFLYGLNCYVMMWLFKRARERQKRQDERLLERFNELYGEDDLPVVTVQLPVYNERLVIERLIDAACSIDWPRDKLEVQVLDDSTDDSRQITAELVEKYRAMGHDIKHIHRTNRTGFKAGALANGMNRARGEFFAIFDADFVPPKNFLRDTIPFLLMDERCGFVQTRWGHRNRNYSLLTQAQAIGIDGHFVVEQSARAWNGLFLNFNGTAGVWRKKAIEEAGGWQDDTITEDLDLSYRAQLSGWHGRFLFDTVTPAELPTNINAFKSQQYRWAKGSIQTAIKLLPKILRHPEAGIFKKLQAVLHLTHYMVHPIIFLMVLLVLPLLMAARDAFEPLVVVPLLAMMVLSMVAPSALYVFSQRQAYPQEWKSRLKYLPVLVVLGMGLAINNTLGVIGALIRRKNRDEFVRTPKLGMLAEVHTVSGSAASLYQAATLKKKAAEYRIPLKGMFLIEGFMFFWTVAAFAQYMALYKFVIGPILLLHAAGFAYVCTTSIIHEARTRKMQ